VLELALLESAANRRFLKKATPKTFVLGLAGIKTPPGFPFTLHPDFARASSAPSACNANEFAERIFIPENGRPDDPGPAPFLKNLPHFIRVSIRALIMCV